MLIKVLIVPPRMHGLHLMPILLTLPAKYNLLSAMAVFGLIFRPPLLATLLLIIHLLTHLLVIFTVEPQDVLPLLIALRVLRPSHCG
jgi:hypothetical protein